MTTQNIRPFPDYERLKRIDWTFAEARTRGETHGVHPYPAKFIPQIPQALIAALHPGDSTSLFDPFCGSGTALVEAAVAGVSGIGVDLNPLACLLAKVKATPLSGSLVEAARGAVHRTRYADDTPPVIPALDHWFRADVQRALAALSNAIKAEPDADMRDALQIAMSRIIVRVSNQESDTRYAAVEKELASSDVRKLFLGAAKSIESALTSTWSSLFPQPLVRVINKDILRVRPEDVGAPVSLVVTSPPYPNAYEYWLYHKYRMYWLGMDPLVVRENEIGARPHFFKRNPHTALDFERQMSGVFALLRAVMVPGGHACFQVGTSVIRGQVIDNAGILSHAAVEHSFRTVAAMRRDIPSSRKAFNPRHSRIKEEQVLVFRLDVP